MKPRREPAMQVLLKRDNDGQVLKGADQQLCARAQDGDDLCLFIESIGYDETIIFGNYVLHDEGVSALSLPHLAHGDMPDPQVFERETVATAQYIYDSKTNNVLVKDFIDKGRTSTTVFSNNPVYLSYTWYSTRRYTPVNFQNTEELIACGDQFKIRLDLTEDFKIVLKPDIIYFPYQTRDYLVKSSAMLLPTEFVDDPRRYLTKGRSFTANNEYCLSYLNIDSDKRLTIIGKPRFIADKHIDDHVQEGTVSRPAEGHTLVTQVSCAHVFLLPEKHAKQKERKGIDQ
jgi:hypothetical protein